MRCTAIVERVAVEPSVRWIDAQSRKDVLNFYDFDPVDGIGVDAGPAPLQSADLEGAVPRDAVAGALQAHPRANFFRMHYQFIMANDRRAPYDYFMLACGPVPVEEWATRGNEVVAAFGPDADYKPSGVIPR